MTVPGIGGGLLPSHFTATLHESFAGRLGEDTRDAARHRFVRWWRGCGERFGPSSSPRSMAEGCATGLFDLLGFRLAEMSADADRQHVIALGRAPDGTAHPVIVTRWCDDLDRRWALAVRQGTATSAAWTFCWNGRELRLVDASRPWSRRHVSFDLASCAAHRDTFAVFWALMRSVALMRRRSGRPPRERRGREADRQRGRGAVDASLFGEVIEAASLQSQAIGSGLERGVGEALGLLANALIRCSSRRVVPGADELFHQSLTVLYRILFLLFAEARTLVPMWHHTYREAYSIESLREAIEREPAAPGLWPALQAIARLAHRGCRVGTLRVTPFNGHLFAPERAPLIERAVIRDDVLRRVLEELTTTRCRNRRLKIAFGDLGVEQLGAIYERVLDHRLVIESPPADVSSNAVSAPHSRRPERPSARLVATAAQRKASATYYTPRSLTELIVRRTLAPLVAGATSDQILRLRILDPAMGSGAFLVACNRYLSAAYEAAVVGEQQLRDHEVTEADRAGFRRAIARRCLFGVDRNPMAVQLARLSLWLATLAADVPLTFLDHHLREGDSLVGASLADLLRQQPGKRRGRAMPPLDALPLLASTDALDAMRTALPACHELEAIADDRIEAVRYKEHLLGSLRARGTPLARWKDAADIWCSAWFWSEESLPPPTGPWYGELLAATLGRQTSVSEARLGASLDAVRVTAARERFFHWPFEFPDVFAHDDDRGTGFDAVVGNPPWDMVRRDGASAGHTGSRPGRFAQLTGFVRESGIYGRRAEAHANLYLLFLERVLQLLRLGGRLGMVVPWGFAIDRGAAGARRELMRGSRIDTWLCVDNRQALFPIHRSLRLLVLTATSGTPTRSVPLARCAGENAALDAISDEPDIPGCVRLSRDCLERVSPGVVATPDVESHTHLALLEKIHHAAPTLASSDGWGVHFGRELNASDDRDLFHAARSGMPVLEGKHIDAFRCHADRATSFMTSADAARRLASLPFDHPRVAYRDVASATNQRTLIAAIVPAGTVTTHTLFCLRERLDQNQQRRLCGVLNSFVANWLVRRWVSSHVTVALVEQLPAPPPSSPALEPLPALVEQLEGTSGSGQQEHIEARLQARVALAYGLTRNELALLLDDFPLVNVRLRRATLSAFDALIRVGPEDRTRDSGRRS